MPVYDFKCKKCGKTDEQYVPKTDSTPEKCFCNKGSKMIKITSFTKTKPILKGNGFYETDYKNN